MEGKLIQLRLAPRMLARLEAVRQAIVTDGNLFTVRVPQTHLVLRLIELGLDTFEAKQDAKAKK